MKRIHLFYCPVMYQCKLLISVKDHPRLTHTIDGAKPVLVVSSGYLEQAKPYLHKLERLLDISTEWFGSAALVKAAWYVAQFDYSGGKVQKFRMDTNEERSARNQLHTMALTTPRRKPKSSRGALLWGRLMYEPNVTELPK
jgi:hypothetical protein